MLWGAVPVSSGGSRVWQKKIPRQRPRGDSRIVQTEAPPQGGVARGESSPLVGVTTGDGLGCVLWAAGTCQLEE